MLTRVQLRASGDTAHSVEAELRRARDAILEALEVNGDPGEQVVEGTPGKGFNGRLTFHLADPQKSGTRRIAVEIKGPLDAQGIALDSERGKAVV